MLISKSVKIRWNGSTKKYYENKGYTYTKMNDWFECKIEDVQVTSPVPVLVQCDYCDEPHIYEKEYRRHIKSMDKNGKDCCDKSTMKKVKETMMKKYGVDNPLKLDRCKEAVSAALRTPFKDVKQYCEDKGLILLNDEEDYKSDRSKLKVICRYHEYLGIQDTSFMKIKKNAGCCGTGGNEIGAFKHKIDGQVVYDAFILQGLEPQFRPDDYAHNSDLLPYICIKHKDKGIQFRSYSDLKYTHGCGYCGRESTGNKLRQNQDKVFNDFISKGLIPIEGQVYKNTEQLIYYRCINHPNVIQHASHGNLSSTFQGCDCCRVENSFTGLNRYLRSCINQWKEDTEKSCEYKCILTGNLEYDIHHLYSFNSIIKESLDILNIPIKQNPNDYQGEDLIKIKEKVIELHSIKGLGICISNDLHVLFHSLYTKFNNTSEQFEEFKKRYFMGEFQQFKIRPIQEATNVASFLI